MPIIKWADIYTVGIEQIDEEHKTLIDMINRAFDSNKDKAETIAQLTEDMKEYAIMHFATENKFMADYGFPEEASHAAMHADFLSHSDGENPLEPIQLIKFLADWLNSHILESDKALGEFLQSKGVS